MPRLHPSLGTPPSTAPAARIASSKRVRFTDQRDNKGHGGNALPAYSLLHITCDCDDTDVDTMYRTCCITTGNSLRHTEKIGDKKRQKRQKRQKGAYFLSFLLYSDVLVNFDRSLTLSRRFLSNSTKSDKTMIS